MLLRAWVRRVIDRDPLTRGPVRSLAPGPWRLAGECADTPTLDAREALARRCLQTHPGWEHVILPAGTPPVIPPAKG